MALSDVATTTGLLFKINADAKDAVKEVERFQKAIEKDLAAGASRIEKANRIIDNADKTFAAQRTQRQKQASNDFLRLLDQTNKEAEAQIRKSSETFTSSVREAAGSFRASFLGNLAANAVTSLARSFVEGGKAVLDYSARLEQTRIGFTTVIGNSEKATKLLKELETFSKSTPFAFEGLLPIAQRLLGANVELEKLIPLMRDLGNVTAATGATSVERLEGIGVAITQIISKGKVSAEEMEQLAERGIPAWNILSQAIGKSVAETRKLSEEGQISADVMVQALRRISQEKYGDAMAKQAETFSGAMTRIKDVLLQTAETAFKPLYDEIAKMAVNISREIDGQERSFFEIGTTIASHITEGTARAILEYDYKGLFDKVRAGMKQDVEDRGWVRSLLFSGVAGPGIERGLNNALGVRLPDQIAREAREIEQALDKSGKLMRDIPLKYTANFRPLSREGDIVRGLDTVTNTIKEINVGISKMPPIKLSGVENAKKQASELKKQLKEAAQTFDAASLAAFTRNQGFKPGSGFTKEGHNTGSLHGRDRALDVGLNASNTDKTVNDVVKFMADAIKAGIRVVDERIRPTGQKKWSAAHLHLEENDKRASFFQPGRVDYAGQLEYLQALDKERLAGKRDSVSAALDPEAAKRRAEEAEREQKALTAKLEREREMRVRAREETDNRILELARTTGEQELAVWENMLARRQITEAEFIELRNQNAIDALQLEERLLEERLKLPDLKPEDQVEIVQKLALLASKVQTTIIRQQTESTKRLAEASEAFVKELQEHVDRQFEIEQEILAIRREARDLEREIVDFRKDQERKVLENTVDSAPNSQARIAAIRELREFDITEAFRKRQAREDELNEEEAARKRNAAATIEDKVLLEEKNLAIEKLYQEKRAISEEEFQARLRGIRSGSNAAIQSATNPSGIGQLGEELGAGLNGLLGGTKETLSLMQPIVGAITDSFNQMAQAVGESVKAFVLFGSAGGSFKKFAAELIASIAQMAAVQAVWNLAEGFAKLALAYFGYAPAGPSATAHFVAAGIYAGIAGIAAIGGRAVAGNSFKQQSSASAATGGANSSSRSNTASEKDPRQIEEERLRTREVNQRGEQHVYIHVQSNDSHILKTVEKDIGGRGNLHGLLVKMVEG